MNHSTGPAGTPADSRTVTVFDPSVEHQRPTSRPCMALVTGTGPHISREIHDLLRHRLRVAGLIGLAGFGLFFLKGLFVAPPTPDPVGWVLHAGVVAVLFMCCAGLWTKANLSIGVLRG